MHRRRFYRTYPLLYHKFVQQYVILNMVIFPGTPKTRVILKIKKYKEKNSGIMGSRANNSEWTQNKLFFQLFYN